MCVNGSLAEPIVCLRDVCVMVNIIDPFALSNQLGVSNKTRTRGDGTVGPTVTRSLGGGDGDHALRFEEVDRILDVVWPAVD